PDSVDLRDEPEVGARIRAFIETQLSELAAYDGQRPDDITYIFHEHAQRVAENVRRACLHMGLGAVVAENMYWAALPHDIGKRLLPLNLWDQEEKPDGLIQKFRRTHTLLGAQ